MANPTNPAGGGGSGGCVDAIIANPGTYTFTFGTAGISGTGFQAGGAGATGIIIVDEFYE